MVKLCPSCNIEKDIILFGNNKRRKDGNAYMCKECESSSKREFYKNNPEKVKYYKRNENKEKKRDYLTEYKHKVSRNDLLEILKKQGGCKICKVDLLEKEEKWFIDHDHNCCPKNTSCEKCRRGILCRNCNLMLGYAKDNLNTLQEAISYLEKHEEKVKDGNT